jgi:hypothetical protein
MFYLQMRMVFLAWKVGSLNSYYGIIELLDLESGPKKGNSQIGRPGGRRRRL